MDKQRKGCGTAAVAAAIVGVMFMLAGIVFINDSRGITCGDDASVVLIVGLGAVGLGPILCVAAAVVSHVKREENGSPNGLDKRPPEEHPCPNCGCQGANSSGTCKWCGADLK